MFLGNAQKHRDTMLISRVSKNIYTFKTGKGYFMDGNEIRLPKSEVLRMCKQILKETEEEE